VFEYFYDKTLAARIGYKIPFAENNIEGFKGFTAGIGIRYGDISFDYALMPYGDLGFTQKGTLSYAFGSSNKQVEPRAGELKALESAENDMAEPEAGTGKKAVEKKPAAKKPETGKAAAKKPAAVKAQKNNAMYDEALALEKQGEIDKAVAKYRQALTADAKIAAAWKRLGGLYLQKNDKAEAIKCYDEYLRLNPNDKEMADWLKAYKKAK